MRRKVHCHPTAEARSDPIGTPTTVADNSMPVTTPTFAPRVCGVERLTTSPKTVGMTIPAPSPASARQARPIARFGAAKVKAVPAPKTANPATATGRRPR